MHYWGCSPFSYKQTKAESWARRELIFYGCKTNRINWKVSTESIGMYISIVFEEVSLHWICHLIVLIYWMMKTKEKSDGPICTYGCSYEWVVLKLKVNAFFVFFILIMSRSLQAWWIAIIWESLVWNKRCADKHAWRLLLNSSSPLKKILIKFVATSYLCFNAKWSKRI